MDIKWVFKNLTCERILVVYDHYLYFLFSYLVPQATSLFFMSYFPSKVSRKT
jgi:hypothetical protein